MRVPLIALLVVIALFTGGCSLLWLGPLLLSGFQSSLAQDILTWSGTGLATCAAAILLIRFLLKSGSR